ncbi:DEMETER-like protein 2 [Miscanthus floridulus]|uniref:DEMETER-like protein 2 n=1 Tax=Miscanthus floridulus TaxID=154761 RepID=UPI003457D243
MAFRILFLLIRIKRDQGSIDLEWLRYIPRAKAKKYLQSIIGIGYKSVDCIRLLSLRHRGFPVDVNVARIVTRLGWVPLQPLGDSIQFHMVDKEPVMAKIQEYLEPLFCNIPSHIRYELHCQQITFGKLICVKNRPNCGACPFTEDCKYYKSLFEIARHDALLKYSQQDEGGQTDMVERIHDAVMVKPSREHMYQCQIEMGKSIERHNTEPIIEIPPTPPHEYPESSSEEEYEQEYQEEYEQEYHNIVDIEDVVPCYDVAFDIRPMKPTEHATTGPSQGTDMILIHPHDNPIPIQRRYNLRTEYLAYIIPDGHEILDTFEPRVHGDCNPYLFIIRDYDDHSVNATILIPCRTANREIFPLDGTYFQINEVFADHSSTRSPIQIKRDIFWNFRRCRVYFGTSLTTIARGQTQEGIQRLYHSGYICCREFDRSSRHATILSPALHTNTTNRVQQRTGKKRHVPNSSPNSVEDNDKDRAQCS